MPWSMRCMPVVFRAACGGRVHRRDGELLISKSAVSGITDRLWEDYQAFITRDLSEVEARAIVGAK